MLKVIFGVGIIVFLFQNVGTSVIQCDKFQSQENLNMEKMLGRWNIVRDNIGDKNRETPCFFINLKKYEPDRFSFDLCVDSNGFYCKYNFAYLTSSGELSNKTIGNSTNSKALDKYYVRETDYDNYAVFHIQICPKNHMIILSRHNVFNEEEINKLTEKYFDKTVTYMNSFTNCGNKSITT